MEEEYKLIKCVDNSTPSKKISSRIVLDVIGISDREKGYIGIRKLKDWNLRGLEGKKEVLLITVFWNVIVRTSKALLP